MQQPSSDPYIESFDDADLSRLTQEVPAVIETGESQVGGRTQVPCPREARSPGQAPDRREQGAAQAETAEGEAEQQQQTLRLF